MIEFTYGAGGKQVDASGHPVDGYPFDFDPFGNLVMPDTDVDLYYIYAPYYSYQEPEIDDSLDKIVIYVNRPNGDINPSKQQYQVYEIFHVTKSDDVQEDVTNDYTVGQTMPESAGFSYWISPNDPWFDIIQNSPYFNVTETSDPNRYCVSLKDSYSHEEATAIEIASYLENRIPNEATPRIVTADTPSYDNDPGYYLIISEINSNLILGTTNIAITEKAEYPTIEKKVDDSQVQIGQIVTFTIEVDFPKGSKAESIITDTMTEGLTYIEDSIESNIEGGSFELKSDVNGWSMTYPKEVITDAFKSKGGTLKITYQARVNENAVIGSDGVNKNTAQLEFSHFTVRDSVELSLTNVTLLKYAGNDSTKQPLPGAKFALLNKDKDVIPLVTIEEGKIYKIAEDADSNGAINNFTTGTSTLIIEGLAADEEYYFKENEAPSGYNLIKDDVTIEGNYVEIENTTGAVLPSTGGSGTKMFYIIGCLLILSAAIGLVIKKKFEI